MPDSRNVALITDNEGKVTAVVTPPEKYEIIESTTMSGLVVVAITRGDRAEFLR